MIVLGDIASPGKGYSQVITTFFEDVKMIDKKQTLLFNLEGLISDIQNVNEKTPILFNHSSVLNAFKGFSQVVAALANNHTLDLPHLLDDTKIFLNQNNILTVGAGRYDDLDFDIVSIIEEGIQIFIINACWDFLLYHQDNTNPMQKVNTINEHKILAAVKKIKKNHPKAKIVTYFHWSFDLEIYPSPLHRVFSKDLIDTGVSLVIGCHSHCVQGGEKYKNGYIIYGLGNFYLPSGIYANGKLKFPAMSALGWIIQWDIKSNSLRNIWIDTSDNNLNLVLTDTFEDSDILNKYSPYSGLSDKEYVDFFRKNRRKKKFNPIFYDYRDIRMNNFKMLLLKNRAKFARLAAKLNLIGWQN